MKKYLEHETEATKYFAKQKKAWAKQTKEEKELEKKMVSKTFSIETFSSCVEKLWIHKGPRRRGPEKQRGPC